MRLLLIRHGETIHNVAGVYAGITDSPLTTHGVLQADRLGKYLSTELKVSKIFSSDLQRAVKTAEAVLLAQDRTSPFFPRDVTKLALLREQDYGSMEGKSFRVRAVNSSNANHEEQKTAVVFKDVESATSMKRRMKSFLDQHLVPYIISTEASCSIVVVAHGIILTHLWTEIVKEFLPGQVALSPQGQNRDRMLTLESI
ncbi:hypothetical protein DH86_00003705, partial [Scytalidium sp. 3C]